MVKGLNIFREYFNEYSEQYVLIGGAACDVIFEEQAASFRATKDLDLVLIVEALTPEFGRNFWRFIRDGGYENRAKSNGSPQFYRFDKPKTAGFPYMIEIFSRIENAFQSEDIGPCIPLPLGDEISSLSAILLNEDYYSMLLKEKNIVSGITVLSPVCLILFKAKAWLDLQERKTQGIHIDEKDIRKHKNDIMRLTSLLTGEERCELPEIVRLDMSLFIEKLSLEPVNLKSLNLPGVTFEDVLSVLKRIYLR